MSSEKLRFVVHEHKATRLHYDFRIELEGVLKSWAVPKGPSMNPADKRLAIMVHDHQLSYYNFEGVIPEGNYGAGPVVIWDAGEFKPLETEDPAASLQNGKLVFELKGKKLKGVFTIARMKGLPKSTGKEWLLIKKKDDHANPDFVLKSELTPARLAKLKEKVPPCDSD